MEDFTSSVSTMTEGIEGRLDTLEIVGSSRLPTLLIVRLALPSKVESRSSCSCTSAEAPLGILTVFDLERTCSSGEGPLFLGTRGSKEADRSGRYT